MKEQGVPAGYPKAGEQAGQWGWRCTEPHCSSPPPQIFNDVLSNTCIRLSQEERLRLKSLFGNLRPAAPRGGGDTYGGPNLGGSHPSILISWASPSR